MPLHRTSRDNAETFVAELEAKGERVAAVAPDGDGLWIITDPSRRTAPQGIEKRGGR